MVKSGRFSGRVSAHWNSPGRGDFLDLHALGQEHLNAMDRPLAASIFNRLSTICSYSEMRNKV